MCTVHVLYRTHHDCLSWKKTFPSTTLTSGRALLPNPASPGLDLLALALPAAPEGPLQDLAAPLLHSPSPAGNRAVTPLAEAGPQAVHRACIIRILLRYKCFARYG